MQKGWSARCSRWKRPSLSRHHPPAELNKAEGALQRPFAYLSIAVGLASPPPLAMNPLYCPKGQPTLVLWSHFAWYTRLTPWFAPSETGVLVRLCERIFTFAAVLYRLRRGLEGPVQRHKAGATPAKRFRREVAAGLPCLLANHEYNSAIIRPSPRTDRDAPNDAWFRQRRFGCQTCPRTATRSASSPLHR